MSRNSADALGIILPNSYDSMVPELVKERLMASIPFGADYRVVDFLLSGMVNGGIDKISLVVKENYHSLMTHIGSGREWTRTGKSSGLNLVPPFSNKDAKVYSGRVEALFGVIPFLQEQQEKYVVVCDANLVVNFDFRDFIAKHIESGADITVAYCREAIPAGYLELPATTENLYYTLQLTDGRVSEIAVNAKCEGEQNLDMNFYVMERELLIGQIMEAHLQGGVYYERDILARQLDRLNVRGYCFEGYLARISSVRSYFEENMRLLDEANVGALFGPAPIYTKTCDEHPTCYRDNARVKRIIAADGCIIDGEVENSILFCGVRIGRGAKVKNCVLMNGTVVEDGANIENVIADKKVVISAGKELKGTDTFPVFLEKRKKV